MHRGQLLSRLITKQRDQMTKQHLIAMWINLSQKLVLAEYENMVIFLTFLYLPTVDYSILRKNIWKYLVSLDVLSTFFKSYLQMHILTVYLLYFLSQHKCILAALSVFKLEPNVSILSLTHSLDWKQQAKRFLFIYFAEHYSIFKRCCITVCRSPSWP